MGEPSRRFPYMYDTIFLYMYGSVKVPFLFAAGTSSRGFFSKGACNTRGNRLNCKE